MDLRNFKNLLSNFPVLTYVKNSLIVVFCACFFNVVTATMAGYAFAKKKFPMKEVSSGISGNFDAAGTGHPDSGIYNYEADEPA